MINKRKLFAIETAMKAGGIPSKVQLHINHMFAITAAKYPHLTEQQISDLKSKFGAEAYSQKLVDIFDEHFSDEEIQQIHSFWSSKVGRKLTTGAFLNAEQKLALDWVANLRAEIMSCETGKEQSA